ncbi:hypothetical protein PLIP_a2937 [Pseudoalteromonas lipolytica LMEB 39]|nr:hypothetical protein [Pseudoalteromonas lipolytica LMEB 39]
MQSTPFVLEISESYAGKVQFVSILFQKIQLVNVTKYVN